MAHRPNILFIMLDQARADLFGPAGHEACPTPNLDRLCSESLWFDRAYCTAPMCTPARGSIHTGLFPGANGAAYNDATPFRDVPMLGECVAGSGYAAAHIGKWHLDGGFYFGYGRPDGGFDPRWWYDGQNWSDDIGPEAFAHFRAYKKMPLARKQRDALPREQCWATRVTDRAVRFLAERHDRPWFLTVSYDEPHQPHMAPPEFYDRIDPERLPLGPNSDAPLEGKPALQRLRRARAVNSEQDIRTFQHSYWACLSYADDEIGRLLDRIDDDTVVVVTSDHGEMCAAHGQWSKPYQFYEESIRIPLAVRLPGGRTGRTDALASQVDLVPTFLELADAQPLRITHGRSLVPHLGGQPDDWREHLLVAFDQGGNGRSPMRPEKAREPASWAGIRLHPARAIVSRDSKLVVNLFDRDELYDLSTDPHELSNRINDPRMAPVRNALHRELLAAMDQTDDPRRCPQWLYRPWANGADGWCEPPTGPLSEMLGISTGVLNTES